MERCEEGNNKRRNVEENPVAVTVDKSESNDASQKVATLSLSLSVYQYVCMYL